MKLGVIKYSSEFRTPDGFSKWAGIEKPYNEDSEDPLEVYAKAVETIERAIKIQLGKQDIQIKKEDRGIGVKLVDIESCDKLIVLESYKFLVKGKPELENAYNKRRSEIVSRDQSY